MAASIKTYVIDTSFLLAFLLPDEHDDTVNKIFVDYTNSECRLITSKLIIYELYNTLRTNIMRKRTSVRNAQNLQDQFSELSFDYREPNFSDSLNLALKKDLSFYDAVYVALAKEENATLLTLDRKLKKLVC